MKISVIIINYNYGEYILDAINSVLNQSVCPDEFIIVDDCSTDNSQSIIQEVVNRHPHIRYFKNEQNLGVAKTTNIAVNFSTNKYIALLASDDIYLPNFIERSITALNKFPYSGVICSKFSFFKEKNLHEIKCHPRVFNSPDIAFLKGPSLIKTMRTYKFWIPSPVILNKDLFYKFGGYNEGFGEYTDFFLLALIAFESGTCYIPETLCAVRTHRQQLSKNINLKDKQASWKFFLQLLSSTKLRKYKAQLKKSHLLYLLDLPFFSYLIRNPRFWSFADYSLWKKMFNTWRRKRSPLLEKKTL